MTIGTLTTNPTGSYGITVTHATLAYNGSPVASSFTFTPMTAYGVPETTADEFAQDIADALAAAGFTVSGDKQFQGSATITPTE